MYLVSHNQEQKYKIPHKQNAFNSILTLELTFRKKSKHKFNHRPLRNRYSFESSPSLAHQFSIVSPSKRWTSDGEAMDKRWRSFGGTTDFQGSNKQLKSA